MELVRRIGVRLYMQTYLLKVAALCRVFGIEYVAAELTRCSRSVLPVLLARHGAVIGDRVNFKRIIHIDNACGDQDALGDFSNLEIGNNCYIGTGVFFDMADKVIIEDEAVVSAGVSFITHADCGGRIMSRWYPRQRSGIRIGYGSWIGVNAAILHGVELGRCCVVAAGAVVTRSFPAYSVIAGVPAKLVKTLPAMPGAAENHNARQAANNRKRPPSCH